MTKKDELNALKQQYETLNNKLKELNEEELKEVIGGTNVMNSDGTITLLKGQCYYDSYSPFNNIYKVLEDYINVSEDTTIKCLTQWTNSGGVIKYEDSTKRAIDFTANTYIYWGIDRF